MRSKILFLLVLFPLIMSAQWSTDPGINNPINTMTGEQAIPKVATCPNGDTYIASFSMEGGNYNVRMQRLDMQGNPLWATNGILISSHPQMSWLTDWDMTADPANHAILTFQDIRNGGNNNVVAYRIAPDGSFAWGADGIALSNSTAFNAAPKVTVTAAGNAVFAWQADDVIILQKVNPAGALQWGTSGITLSGTNTYSWPQLLPVGTDEVILKYFEDIGSFPPTRHVYAQRYNASGTAVWSSPAGISNAGGISPWTQIFPFVNDGSDGFYIAWHDDRDNNMLSSTWVHHISSSGSELFPDNGVEASTLGGRNHFYPQLALPPGTSDVFVLWNEMNGELSLWGIYGQKLSSSGSRLWTTTGQVFIEISSTNVYPFGARNSPTDAVLFYLEYFDPVNTAVKAMRINASGGFVWTPSLAMMSSVSSEKVHPEVNDFQDNQWIAAWEDDRSGNRDIFAQNIQLEGILGPWDSQIGTIQGNVTLIGGSASVTMANVTAAGITVHPDANGDYTMDVPAGTWDVSASLTGYYPDTVFSVVVADEQITPGIDMILQALPTGSIEGTVTLDGGEGDVTDVVVSAGYHTTNPDTNGFYSMVIEIGIYDVTAVLTGYLTGIQDDIVVEEGMVTVGVDFLLEPVPTTGFITGIVELENDAGDVTLVDVTAGAVTVHPDTDGFYALETTPGPWDVSASLEGFYTSVQEDVMVIVGDTTSDIDFFLYQMSQNGVIAGNVTLVNGIGDVTQAVITAGTEMTNPNASGHYFLTLPPGTYTVMATHPLAWPDSIENIVVTAGVTIEDADFALEIIRTDLVVRVVDQFGMSLTDATVEVIGPDSTYTGTILEDSLIFADAQYGQYTGTAWFYDEEPVESEVMIGVENNEIVFVFWLIGLPDAYPVVTAIQAYPNPFSGQVNILFDLPENSHVRLTVLDLAGRVVSTLVNENLPQGNHSMTWYGSGLLPGIYALELQTSRGKTISMLVKI